jgi:eukaryotic-like serine/threonine-protein kinase
MVMPDLIGQSIDRYHIIEKLGEGGMAAVYKALDTQLERHVALKVILQNWQVSNQFLRRFELEAKALAQLSHPNIIPIHDYGEHQGLPYLVMEYVPGGTLRIEAGRTVPASEAARLLLPVARALEYAHQQGIIHRDVKPANILITESGEAMLSDFGIAKMLDTGEFTRLTRTGTGIGTPEYMAPEQGMGKDFDQRVDIYALGVVLYEMVTGRVPFRADTPMAVMLKKTSEPLPNPHQFVPELPADAEHIIIKALAVDPKNRFQDMRAFIDALENLSQQTESAQWDTLLRSETPPVDQITTKPGITETLRDNKWLLLTTVLMLFLVVGGGILLGIKLLGNQGGQFSLTANHTPSPTAAQTTTPTQAPQQAEVALPSPTTPLEYPLTIGTPLPSHLESLNDENILQVEELARWGKGVINDILYSPDGEKLAIYSAVGVSIYDTETLLEEHIIEIPFDTRHVAISPDSTMLAIGGMDLTRIWRIEDNSIDRVIDAPGGIFSPDWTKLAATSVQKQHTALLYDSTQSELIATLEGHEKNIYIMKFSSDSLLLATGSYDTTIRLWDANTGDLVHILQGHQDSIRNLIFSADNTLLASTGLDNTLRVWDVSKGEMRYELSDFNAASPLEFSADSATLAAVSSNTAWILNSVDGSILHTFEGHESSITTMDLSQDGSMLATGSTNGTLLVWDTLSGTLLHDLEESKSNISRLAFSPAGQELVSATKTGIIQVWDPSSGELLKALDGFGTPQTMVTFSPDGSLLASGSGNFKLALIRKMKDGSLINSFEVLTGDPNSLRFLSGDSLAASGSQSYKTLLTWSEKEDRLGMLEEDFIIHSTILSPDGSTVAVGGIKGEIILRKADDGTLLRSLQGNDSEKAVKMLAFSADGLLLAAGSILGDMRVLQVSDGSVIYETKKSGLQSLFFSPDSKLLVLGLHSDVQLIELSNGEKLFTLEGHDSFIYAAAFSQKSNLLATGDASGQILFWNTQDGNALYSLNNHNDGISSLAFSPDGAVLASASSDGTVRLWGIIQEGD